MCYNIIMRVIAGKFKGTKLYTFEYDNIRPTTDRVKENIFNKLGVNLINKNVLDLFGGTGAVSLEFLSRGANVVTVDNNKDSVALIKKNFQKCHCVANLVQADFKVALNEFYKKKLKFDYIFLDPPYNTNCGEESLGIISKYNLLNNGIIVYEHLTDKAFLLPKNFEIFDQKKYGTITVSYIRGCDESS